MPVLRVDSQFTVIEATLKGYMKWRRHRAAEYVCGTSRMQTTRANTMQEQQKAELEANLETWCNKLLEMSFEVRRPHIYCEISKLIALFAGPHDQETNLATLGLLLDDSPQQKRALHVEGS